MLVVYFLLILITLLGAWLRFVNISPFKFYPDAYQSLIVAGNISNYHSVIGPMGKDGMFYPYFIEWTRSGYPLLINFFNIFFNDQIASAQAVAYGTGVLAIFAGYFAASKVFQSKFAGVIAAFLIATSFNHTVWGGFIYTETTGVFLVLLILWRVFSTIEKPGVWADLNDLFIGLLVAAAVVTRYEYIILIAPLIFLILQKSTYGYRKVANIIASFILFTSVVLSQLYPVHHLFGIVLSRFSKFLVFGGVSLAVLAAVIFGCRLISGPMRFRLNVLISRILQITVLVFVLLLLLQFVFPFFPYLMRQLSAPRYFFTGDLALGITVVLGLLMMLQKTKYRLYAYFVIGCIIVLFPVYYHVNPQMQRYWTHMLPFLVIPASFGAWNILQIGWGWTKKPQVISKTRGALMLLMFGLLSAWQVSSTYRGIKYWEEGTWFRSSYDEKSAHYFRQNIRTTDVKSILIAALPETYYVFNALNTHSILETDKMPFLFIDDSLDDHTAYIIRDMGMSDVFPNFDEFVTTSLGDRYKVKEYWVNETYHFSIRSMPEEHPAMVYKIRVGELKEKISQWESRQLEPEKKAAR